MNVSYSLTSVLDLIRRRGLYDEWVIRNYEEAASLLPFEGFGSCITIIWPLFEEWFSLSRSGISSLSYPSSSIYTTFLGNCRFFPLPAFPWVSLDTVPNALKRSLLSILTLCIAFISCFSFCFIDLLVFLWFISRFVWEVYGSAPNSSWFKEKWENWPGW